MRVLYALLLLAGISVDSVAQKKPLDHSVYDSWQSISTSGISKKGDKLYFNVASQEGDDTLYLKSDKNQTFLTLPRGTNAKFSADEKFFFSSISPLYQETRKAKIDKKKKEDMPKDSLAIFDFATQKLSKIAQVKSYQIAEENGNYLVYLQDEIIEKKKPSAKKDSVSTKEKPKKPTTFLVVKNLSSGKDTVFKSVETYELDKWAKTLVFTRKPEEKDSTGLTGGVFKYDLAAQKLQQLNTGKGTFKGFTFDENANQLVYLVDRSEEKALLKNFEIYHHAVTSSDSAKALITAKTSGVPEKWYVSGDANLRFNKSGQRLFLGLAPIPRVKDTTLVEFENAKVDIWHWKDDYLQSQQLVNLKRDLSKNYASVYHFDTPNKVVLLSNPQLENVRLSEELEENYVLASTDFGRRIETQWQTGSFQDYYLVSVKDGSKKLVVKDLRGQASLSPNAKYVTWYNRENQNWYAYQISTGNITQLNKNISVSLADEDNDSPDTPSSYGAAGFTKDDARIWLNDRYDIWSVNPENGEATKLTNGRDSKITYRYVDYKEKKNRFSPTIIDDKAPYLLSTFNNINKENGFAKITPQVGKKAVKEPFKQILWTKNGFGQIKEARDAQVFIYTKENYVESPNLYISKDLVSETKLSDINKQQANYNWGTAELYTWKTPNGHTADGILYKPEDFAPNKTYPIIAYFYEKLSDGLYKYQAPAPTPSRLNIPYFVSNGYVVFAPDISYEIGYPGKSAEEFINSGMAELKKNKWAGKLAIQGQSWGGYQVAHLITVTDMYDAAWSGAPVVNMTSAYGGIRWGTGMNRQFQYERTQSRLGATLWEKPELYLENSPLFNMDKVKTPVVIMHNDQDGAVPWYQGIEFFTALRRLQKPVWMLNYNGDDHNLIQRQNRKDIQKRQQQFFDHFLKSKPAAPWIETGVPATLKGIDWGFGE